MSEIENPWDKDRLAGIAYVYSAIQDILKEAPKAVPEEFIERLREKYPDIETEYDMGCWRNNQERIITVYSRAAIGSDHLFVDARRGKLRVSNRFDYSIGEYSGVPDWVCKTISFDPETGELIISDIEKP